MLRLTRHAQAEPHTSTPRRHDLGVLRTDEFFFDIARYRNETHVHPRTRRNIVTDSRAFSRPARAVENWAPAAAGRTVKRARPAFGGCNASYAVERRLFGGEETVSVTVRRGAVTSELGARSPAFLVAQSARRWGSWQQRGCSTVGTLSSATTVGLVMARPDARETVDFNSRPGAVGSAALPRSEGILRPQRQSATRW